MYKSQLYFYTLEMNLKMKKTIPFIITSVRIKWLGINLTNVKHTLNSIKHH